MYISDVYWSLSRRMDPVSIFLNFLLGTLSGGVVVLADNADKRKRERLEKESKPRLGSITSLKALRSHVDQACEDVGHRIADSGKDARSQALSKLLVSEQFKELFSDWIANGSIPEGRQTRARLVSELR